MKSILFLFLLATLLSCTNDIKPLPDAGQIAKPMLDSSRINDLLTRLNRGNPYPNLPDFNKIDSVYLFEMHGSWGGLYSCSAVFSDSSGYTAISDHRLSNGTSLGYTTHSINRQIISRDQWFDMNRKTVESGFWNFTDSFTRSCVDG